MLEKFAESIIADSILEHVVDSKVILIKDDNNSPVYLQAKTMDSLNIYKKKRKYVKDSLIKQNNGYAAAFEYKYNFHNQYLQTFAEIGIFGFIVLFGLFFTIVLMFLKNLRHQLRFKKQLYSDEAISILASFFMTLFPFLPSGNFFNNWLSILYFLPVGFFLHEFKKR